MEYNKINKSLTGKVKKMGLETKYKNAFSESLNQYLLE